ncbi:MAG: DUF3267 domain-containing protein [Oscillospiraceae bacterium]|nr:DUF3267 domain-containing protein [Oscillospiraceae bacterium]
MKLIYQGQYNGDENSLPSSEPVEGAVMFKEAADMKQFAILVNFIALVLMVACIALLFWRGGLEAFSFWGYVLFLVTLFPHELLHGICFKENVYLYTNWKQGMLFVTGPEHLSKRRFIFMSLLPNVLFGFLPFLIFLINPGCRALGTFGAIAIGAGAGDYYNVWNALTQVPKGGMIYNRGFHSWWYVPEKKKEC